MAGRRRFSWKVFISLALTLSFALASVSGIVLYFTPRGRVANWVQWEVLGLTRDEWTDLHLVAIAIMLVAGLLHLLWINWKPFLAYLGRTAHGALRYPREIAAALVVFLLLFLGVLMKVPGPYMVVEAREAIKDGYETADYQPPVAHAEELTVAEFAARVMERPADSLLARLEGLGWPAQGSGETMGRLAERYGVSPQRVFLALQDAGAPDGEGDVPAGGAAQPHTPSEGGYGYGMMTLDDLARSRGWEPEALRRVLGEMGVADPEHGATLRTLATELDLRPSELIEAVSGRMHD